MSVKEYGRDQREYISFRESDSSDNFQRPIRIKHPYENKIIQEAKEILLNEIELDASKISINFQDGCLILSGEVLSRKDKKYAEHLVENILGVVDVMNQLRISEGLDSSGTLRGQYGQ